MTSRSSALIPLEWPPAWSDPSILDSVAKTRINALFCAADSLPAPVATRAQALGLRLLDASHLPEDCKVMEGEWPGIRLSRTTSGVDAGPTGNPWIDSNTWRVRLAKALDRTRHTWVRSTPPQRVIVDSELSVGYADSAMAGGQWIITPPPGFQSWSQLGATIQFFATRSDWSALEAKANLGVVSTFSGDDEAMASEVLNLTARLQQPYSILLPSQPIPPLRAVICVDEKLSSELRSKLLAFAEGGGLLIVNSTWRAGEKSTQPVKSNQQVNPRFDVSPAGLGQIAIAKESVTDAYQFAADAQLLMSHRWDAVTLWNAGAYGSYLTSKPGGGVLLQLINYTGRAERNQVTARIRGAYHRAVFMQPGVQPQSLSIRTMGPAAEIYLPEFPSYACVELT